MSKNLVIVESPAKAKTIKKYLGKDFEVLASYGHVRDLLPKTGAVDPDKDFAMTYVEIEKNAAHVKTIAKALKKAETLYLATDPDREGEAISWHIYELMKEQAILDDKSVYRVAFYEITKNAITEAIKQPRQISMDLVNSQQARRALDYLVGFNLSPLLWRKIRPGLSAGRVQSPALRMICEREAEIEAFKAQEYWTIAAENQFKKQKFIAKLVEWQGKKLKQFDINNEKEALKIQKVLEKTAQGELIVAAVEKKQRKRKPAPPFTTSTLQQEAARKLGFTTSRTMRTAQQLYEGIDLGDGNVGLITYMRTDSVNIASEAIAEIRQTITERYGKENLPETPCVYQTKTKNAQEAHEAIRMTASARLPEQIKSYLSPEQYKLYDLIWKRSVACQMIHATIDTMAVDFYCGEGNRLRANGSAIAEPGFMSVYQEDQDDVKLDDEDGKMLPPLVVGDKVKLLAVKPEQHFTEPPPRYTEASLVKALEEYGIGRPSTYAAIIHTLQNREYVILEKKRFTPTDVGRIVNKFLTEYFTKYVDYLFTAKLEDELDAVSRGESEWKPMLKQFWSPFKELIDHTAEHVKRSDVTTEATDEKCPLDGGDLIIRLGRRGRFMGCKNYPECNYTRNVDGDQAQAAAEVEVIKDRKCPQCEAELIIRQGRYGKFIGCSAYPKCKFIEPLEKPQDSGVNCPECKKAHLISRKSRYGKIFYSCQRYPDCKYAVWNPPLAEACPNCNWPILTLKTTKRRGTEKVCPQKDCGFAEQTQAAEKDE